MKLHPAARGTYNVITSYGQDYVTVNAERHQESLIVTPERVLAWDVSEFAQITPESFEEVMRLAPEILLLGTGPRQRFPHPSLLAALAEARVGLEVMDLKAACRTYNILVAEERKVAAALLFK